LEISWSTDLPRLFPGGRDAALYVRQGCLMLQCACSARKRLEKRAPAGRVWAVMPLIKLNRINKGGEIVVNSDYVLFVEIESRATTVHMTDNLLFSVEEPLDAIAIKIEMLETARIKNAIQQSGLIGK
jgi:hypothetical protein